MSVAELPPSSNLDKLDIGSISRFYPKDRVIYTLEIWYRTVHLLREPALLIFTWFGSPKDSM